MKPTEGEVPVLDDSGADNSTSTEDEEVGEEGLGRVVELLGEDGLDEMAQMQLTMLNGDAKDDSDDSEADSKEDEDLENEEEQIELDALSDDNISIDADAVSHQKITLDNQEALAQIRENIQLDPSLPWTETLVCSYNELIEVEDVNDDLKRELAFYKQALHSAQEAKRLAAKSNPPLPFSRPDDYYAEMVKSDAHMARIRQRLLDEQAGIKKGEEKRKEREHKKVGKQVQIEKLKERRERGKAEVEKVKGIKRKRQNLEDPSDGFDIAVDDEASPPPQSKRSKPSINRNTRDKKFGFGGKVGRRAKQNTRESTEKIFGGGAIKGKGSSGGRFKGPAKKGGPGKQKRLGKSRRANTKR